MWSSAAGRVHLDDNHLKDTEKSVAPMAMPTADEPTKAADAFVRSRFATKSAM